MKPCKDWEENIKIVETFGSVEVKLPLEEFFNRLPTDTGYILFKGEDLYNASETGEKAKVIAKFIIKESDKREIKHHNPTYRSMEDALKD